MKIKLFTVALLLAQVFSLAQAQAASNVDHYQLHFNTGNNNVTAYACGDSTCSPSNLYTGEIEKLHIHGNQSNFHNFHDFDHSSSITKAWDTSQCTIFTIQNADKNKQGAEPWPTSTPALQCFVDGAIVANCEVCSQPESVSSYGYVYGTATIPSISSNANDEFTVIEGGGNGLAIVSNQQSINNGDKLTLPLDVTFDKAEQVNLVLANINGREFPVNVTFVPKSLAWITANNLDCGASNNSFVYAQQAETCTVLGKAGSELKLVLQAYGEADAQGRPRVINNYQAELGKIMQLQELDAAHKLYAGQVNQAQWDLQFNSKNSAGHELIYFAQHVGLIKATVQDHYAPLGDNAQNHTLKTEGESLVLGRTVPAYLQVTGIAGDIKDNVVYRAKPVEFTLPPQFEVIACAANNNTCKNLPSYTGEFAKGLTLEKSLEFSVDNDPDNQVEIRNASGEVTFDKTVEDIKAAETHTIGTHTIQLSDASELVFDKTDKKPSETILQKLKLSIIIENDTVQPSLPLKGSGNAKLDENEDAELRFGFLSIDNLELPVNTAGDMSVHLNYYGSDIESIRQDMSSKTGIVETSPSLIPDSDPKPPGLEFNEDIIKDKLVKVPARSSEWRGKVEMEVDTWLKPYENGLVNPSAELNITNDARKRGNDRIFNRREVVR